MTDFIVNAKTISTPGQIICDTGLIWTNGSGTGAVTGLTLATNPSNVGSITNAVLMGTNTNLPINGGTLRFYSTITSSTSCTLATGTYDGQVVNLLNVSTNNVTFTVNTGAASIVSTANTSKLVTWDVTLAKWF